MLAIQRIRLLKSSAWYVCSVTTPVFIFVYQLIQTAINYQMEINKVWAIPVSLATTSGIVVYFLFLRVLRCFSSPGSRSSAYVFSWRQHDMTHARFPHSEIFGSKLVWQLPEAYRSLLRPSSVSYVKASVMCAWVTFYEWWCILASYWYIPTTISLLKRNAVLVFTSISNF